MARPGPAPRPSHLAIVEGNPAKKPAAQLAKGLKLPPSAPAEPDWKLWFPPEAELGLTKDERARRLADNRLAREAASGEYRRVVKVLDAQGLLSELDAYVLVDYCVCWVRLGQLERDISRRTMTTMGQKGTARNGSITSATQYRAHLKWLVGELGLSPVARDFVTPDAGDEDGGGGPFD